jgi:catechol 2,3-dioxygenase-like lactoylglutathione lyase family enzyme
MTVKSNPDEWWMSTGDYAKRLKGLTINLLVRDVEACAPFHTQVLGATAEYVCVDFASFAYGDTTWMLHADHTYDKHPLYRSLSAGLDRGIGCEIRLHGRSPDEACAAADRLGCKILERAVDKGHGTREAFIYDPEGYLWCVDVAL